MLSLSNRELREFGKSGYLILRNVIPPANLTAASMEIDRLVNDQPPPKDYVGHHFYWLSTLDGGPLTALFNQTPLRSLAESLIAPGKIEIAFDQVQVALNIPPFSHRPGGHHLDGYLEGKQDPATFTMLAGVLMSEQKIENAGSLWVWPGTHRTHGAFFRKRGPEAFVEAKGYPNIELPEPRQILGGPGGYWRITCLDTILAAIMRARRCDGLCTFAYGGWATSNAGGNVCVMNCLSLMPSVLLWHRRRHDRFKTVCIPLSISESLVRLYVREADRSQ